MVDSRTRTFIRENRMYLGKSNTRTFSFVFFEAANYTFNLFMQFCGSKSFPVKAKCVETAKIKWFTLI